VSRFCDFESAALVDIPARSLGGGELDIVGFQASSLGDTLDHLGTNLFAVVESKAKIRPTRPLQRAMGARTAIFLPADANQGR